MEIGEVRECAHCKGTGSCKCGTCKKKANYPDGVSSDKDVPCSVCGGKGAVWIGPDIVQIRPD